MKISLINIGVTKESYVNEGISVYEKRIRHYLPFEMVYLAEQKQRKSNIPMNIKLEEGKAIQSSLIKIDFPVLLDIKGKTFSSEQFAGYIQKIMNQGAKHIGFIIGGSFGFSNDVYNLVKERISLSDMTFSHQLIRLIFLEQLYRAFTIMNNEPYHHN